MTASPSTAASRATVVELDAQTTVPGVSISPMGAVEMSG